MLHKIKGVDISICTAEQMIAYNFSHTYKDMPADWISSTASDHMQGNPKFDKFDKGVICSLISSCNGKTYFGKILPSYEEVGRSFPVE